MYRQHKMQHKKETSDRAALGLFYVFNVFNVGISVTKNK
jgi:hypothetical protein